MPLINHRHRHQRENKVNFFIKYFIPIAWIAVGIAIMVSPEGRVLQMQIAVGDYKYLVGGGFVLIGLIFLMMIARKKEIT